MLFGWRENRLLSPFFDLAHIIFYLIILLNCRALIRFLCLVPLRSHRFTDLLIFLSFFINALIQDTLGSILRYTGCRSWKATIVKFCYCSLPSASGQRRFSMWILGNRRYWSLPVVFDNSRYTKLYAVSGWGNFVCNDVRLPLDRVACLWFLRVSITWVLTGGILRNSPSVLVLWAIMSRFRWTALTSFIDINISELGNVHHTFIWYLHKSVKSIPPLAHVLAVILHAHVFVYAVMSSSEGHPWGCFINFMHPSGAFRFLRDIWVFELLLDSGIKWRNVVKLFGLLEHWFVLKDHSDAVVLWVWEYFFKHSRVNVSKILHLRKTKAWREMWWGFWKVVFAHLFID